MRVRNPFGENKQRQEILENKQTDAIRGVGSSEGLVKGIRVHEGARRRSRHETGEANEVFGARRHRVRSCRV
jgi:hypothetical protein